MDALQHSIHRMQVVRNLSGEDLRQLADVRYTALNLCTAIIEYLAIAIRHVRSRFYSISDKVTLIIIENVLRSVLVGSKRFTEALRRID